MDKILQVVSDVTRVSIEDIKSKSRKRRVTDARMIFFLLSRENTRSGLIEIGKIVNRDHATVMYGIKTIKDCLVPEVIDIIDKCRQVIKLSNISFPDSYRKPTLNKLQQMFCDKFAEGNDQHICGTTCDNCIFHESNSKEFRVWLKSNY